MRNRILTLLLITLLLAGCNLPGPQPNANTPTPDRVATEVSQLLTQAPLAGQPTAIATLAPTSSAPIVTATQPAPQASPTAAASPTLAPTAPQGATASAALDPNDPKAGLGQPSWQDTLSTGKAFYQYETDYTRVKMEDGTLALTGITANGWHGWSLTHSQQPLNFYIEAALQPQTCSGSDLYGLVFRATDTAGYFFGVTCDGRYNLHARNFDDGSDTVLIDLQSSQAIQAGQPNRLGVRVNGDQIGLYANGTRLQEITDTTFKDKGYFGAFVAANQTAEFTVKMDEISLWKLP